MADDFKEVTLSSLCGGAAEELFAAALGDVLKNVAGPKTDPKKARSITLKVTVVPDDERRMGVVKLDIGTKLVGLKGALGAVYFGHRHGRFTLIQAPEPQALFGDPTPKPRVVDAAGKA